jgi:uncharacterized protein (DUF2252 family)
MASEQQARGRVPGLLPIRYGRMLASPFAFFRGAALLMASDLAPTPVTGLTVQALDKLTSEVDGQPRFAADPPLLVRVADLTGTKETAGLEAHLNGILAGYRRTLEWDRRFLIGKYQVADMARKVVGVGSVGMRCFIVLLTGRDPTDRLYLQVKEAVPSVFSEFVGASAYPSQGERVVAGQRLMQAASDVFLGWHRTRSGPARDYYVRQLRDWKFSLMAEDMDPVAMRAYAQLCGQTLARAHARSGDRIGIGAYLGKSDAFDQAVADFAADYADQNERDHATLAAAVKSGRVPAEPGV